MIRPKMYDENTISIESVENTKDIDLLVGYAKREKFRVRINCINEPRFAETIIKFKKAGYRLSIVEEKGLEKEEIVAVLTLDNTDQITVNHYNHEYLPRINKAKNACTFEKIEEALKNCGDYEGAMYHIQETLGYDKETEQTLHTAIEIYKRYLYSRMVQD